MDKKEKKLKDSNLEKSKRECFTCNKKNDCKIRYSFITLRTCHGCTLWEAE